jgi:hypothetical protein
LYEHMKRAVQEREKRAAERLAQQKELDRAKLFDSIRKDFMTLAIGSIAIFEESSGHLWGHGKPADQLTPKEAQWRSEWAFIRGEILDNVNDKIRRLQISMDAHEVKFIGYNNLNFKGPRDQE